MISIWLRHLIVFLLLAPALTGQAWSAPPQSDDFNAFSLNAGLWTVTDPVGDVGVALDGTRLNIFIPGGVSHDAWTQGNLAPRVMQAVDNTDFQIEAKFESVIDQSFQFQGILVEQDSTNFIRVDFYRNGSSTHLFVATFTGGTPTTVADVSVPAGSPQYLRVNRVGDLWVVSRSQDGSVWDVAANFTFPLAVTSAGIMAGNAGTSPPAHRAMVDYFFNTDSPIVPEDPDVLPDTYAPGMFNVEIFPGLDQIQVRWNTDELADGEVRYGQTTSYEMGSVSHVNYDWQHALTITGLQPATDYNLQIVTRDSSNNVTTSGNYPVTTEATSASDPVIDVWYGTTQRFGDIGVPQRWVNIPGKVTDADGLQSLTYSLNGGPSRVLSVGALDSSRLSNEGDFNIDIENTGLQEGSNTVVITATDTTGHTSQKTVNVNFTSTNTWPDSYSIDWTSVTNINDVAQVVDGLWEIQGANVHTAEIGYDRLIDIGDMTAWDNYEVTVPVTVHSVHPYDPVPAVGLLFRWDGHYDWFGLQPHVGWWPMGAIGWYQFRPEGIGTDRLSILGNEAIELARDTSGKQLQLGVPYIFRMQLQGITGQEGARTRLKVWQQGTPEPATWDLVAQQGGPLYPQTGSILLLAHNVDASFGNVTVVPLPTVDPSELPPVISNIHVSAVGKDTATISWETNKPATSEVDYGPDTAYGQNVSDPVLKTSHALTLNGLAAGAVYHYQVSSTDDQPVTSTSGDQTFTTSAADAQLPGPLLTDLFDDAALDLKWSIVDPVADGTVGMTGTQVSLSVPAGISHDVWLGGNQSLRLMQPVIDADFEVEVKFDSLPLAEYQLQGLLFEQDSGNYLRFDFYGDGSGVNIFSASFVNGIPTVRYDEPVTSGLPLYMRVKRTGNDWSQSYSQDGLTWLPAASFTHAAPVISMGLFAGNAGSGGVAANSPAFTALADHYIVAADSIPVGQDSDLDGLPDNVEPGICELAVCLDPGNPDTDGDGLLDGMEVGYCATGQNDVYDPGCDLNPLSADTDGDGFDDGMELDYGSDPLLLADTPENNYVNNGDINNDLKVDVVDVLLATRFLLGLSPPTAEQLVRADVVPDGQITAGDLVRIQWLAVGN